MLKRTILPITLEDFFTDIPANCTEPVLIRNISDMVSLFIDGEQALQEGDRELYRFWTIEPAPGEAGELAYGVTELYAGTIGSEFNMTHGHYHAGSGAELYMGLKGSGLLLLQNREGDLETIEFGERTITYIPSGWGHRMVNTGDENMTFIAVWPTGIDHDYDAMYTHNFKVRVLKTEDGVKIVPRSED